MLQQRTTADRSWIKTAKKLAAKYGLIAIGIGIILASVFRILISAFPVFFLESDNLDAYYPLYAYFLKSLHHGQIAYYHPFLFAGERLLGNATFQPSPVDLTAGFLFGPAAIYNPAFTLYMLEPIAAFIGMYFLIGVLCGSLPKYTRALLALTYVFSFGYAILNQFPTMSLHFATLPWLLYFLVLGQDRRAPAIFGALFVLFYIQFAYGFLQFSVYVVWISLFFALFWSPWPKTIRAMALLVPAGLIAVLASAHFLLPLIDTLYFAEGAVANRAVKKLDIIHQLVPDFYSLRLWVPTFFGYYLPWWPIRKDGWSPLESFSAYQGLPITLLAVFGLFLGTVPRFFRATYVFLILSVILPLGVLILFIVNLGSSVPYGRQTVLIGFMAPIIAGYVLQEMNRNRRVAGAFAIWCAACALILFWAAKAGLPAAIINYAFDLVRAAFPQDYNPEAANQFIANYTRLLKSPFFWPFLWATACAIIAGAIYALPRFRKETAAPSLAAPLSSILCLIALGMGYFYTGHLGMRGIYENRFIAAARSGWPPEKITLDPPHPIENALISAGAQTLKGPIAFRTHIDISFAEQRHGADLTRDLTGRDPENNRFRALPNFLASENIAVTTGYQNVIPQANDYTQLMIPHYGTTFERGMGERAILHPSMLQAFGIRWVMRHQPDITQKLKGRPDYANDAWEKLFLASSNLIYSDKTYRLYEYNNARPVFDVPERIAFGDSTADTFQALENPEEPWPPTAVVPLATFRALRPAFRRRETTENGIAVLRQSGRIVEADGEPGRWTKLTVVAKTPALVLTGVKYDPWWKATVNGRELPLLRANGIFSAVAVPAGQSEIIIRLRPYSVWAGLAISAVTFIMLAFGLLIVRYRRHLPSWRLLSWRNLSLRLPSIHWRK